MATKVVKSRGKGKRVAVLIDYKKTLTPVSAHKPLLVSLKKRTARNSMGRITTRSRANPFHRRKYRLVDFSRKDKMDISARIESVEYDPNRTAFIMLALYKDGERRYHIAPDGIKVGDTIVCSQSALVKPGNRTFLKNLLPGTEVFEVELTPGSGAKFARSAGSRVIVSGFDEKYCFLKMPSKEMRKVSKECLATIGRPSNIDLKNVKLAKAGRARWKGLRPKVRASVMNPVDHPYGGGEGRTQRGTKRPKTKRGKVTGGRRTRRTKRSSSKLIVKRRSKK